MKVWGACLVSAIIGGLIAAVTVQISGPTAIVAQDESPRRGPGFPLTPIIPKQETLPQNIPKQQPQSPRIFPPGNSPFTPQPPRTNPDSGLFNPEGLTAEEQVNVRVYENVNRSVVNITTRTIRAENFFLQAVPEEGTGSGLVIDNAGHILTNYHVIEDVREVNVTLFDGETYDATYVGADPVNDLAIIRIDAPTEKLIPVRLGDSANLKVGMNVYAIGNPFGLERTLTTGIISSLNRSLKIHRDRTIKSIIQIDAAVNPGNSGGPLLNSRGQVIGIIRAIYSRTGQSSGVGFAIPVNLAKRVIPQLIRHGRVIRPEIGITRVYETEEGLLVAQVTPGGPAETAGIRGPKVERTRRGPFVVERVDRAGADTITAIDGKKVTTVDDFLHTIDNRKPGETVTLTVIREGQTIEIPLRLGGELPQ